jgi:hypothetical protein
VSQRPKQICVFTSHTIEEPRARKNVRALAAHFPQAEIVFVDAAARGRTLAEPDDLSKLRNLRRITYEYPHRGSSVIATLFERGLNLGARRITLVSGRPLPAACSARTRGLLKTIQTAAPRADIYVGHNIDALPILGEIASSSDALLIFDSMEYYSDMGPDQSSAEKAVIRCLEASLLSRMALVLTSSAEVAKALCDAYGIGNTLPLENTAAVTPVAPDHKLPGFHLYWRNSVLAPGPRGLQDAIAALGILPGDVRLHLQGRMPERDGGLERLIRESGVEDKVQIHPAYPMGQAVIAASPYQVGLCLEHDVCLNHRYTVSNKLFDYFMAGMAAVVSDLPGLRHAVEQAGGGLTYAPGNVEALARSIRLLYDRPEQLTSMMRANRAYALREGNEEVVMGRFVAAVDRLLASRADRCAAKDARP